ncbi:MAG: DUF3800 domain-containing protein [Candidatus Brocadiae bacterium]|nr:DUF3800 domain-containing protein [Candidatus Brocadiia bacterium]
MSYLLFMDESGHDHRSMPYEVRGGIALHAGRLWPFIQDVRAHEQAAFGAALHQYGSEIKGHTLLDKDRIAWAAQQEWLDDEARRRHALSFLNRAARKETPTRIEFTAYGQACLTLARDLFRLLHDHEATLFASAIPRGVLPPAPHDRSDLLRKDHVFLLERYSYLLEEKQEHGLLVMDETEKRADRQFMALLRRYFTRTVTGRHRSHWVVPAPLFVSSDLSYPVQAADVCIYCVNVGFRIPSRGMNAPVRAEIADEFGPSLLRLQFKGEGYRDGAVFASYGIVFVPDPYTARAT